MLNDHHCVGAAGKVTVMIIAPTLLGSVREQEGGFTIDLQEAV